jgi:hypothetical protein
MWKEKHMASRHNASVVFWYLVPGLNISQDNSYPDLGFRGFHKSIQANAGIVLKRGV